MMYMYLNTRNDIEIGGWQQRFKEKQEKWQYLKYKTDTKLGNEYKKIKDEYYYLTYIVKRILVIFTKIKHTEWKSDLRIWSLACRNWGALRHPA